MKLYVGVKALIIKEGRVLIVKEAKYSEGTNQGRWDVPGGRIKPEETLFSALEREVREETGLSIRPKNVLYVQENFPSIAGEPSHVVRIHYLADWESGDVTLSKEHNAFLWIGEGDIGDREYVPDLQQEITNYFAKLS